MTCLILLKFKFLFFLTNYMKCKQSCTLQMLFLEIHICMYNIPINNVTDVFTLNCCLVLSASELTSQAKVYYSNIIKLLCKNVPLIMDQNRTTDT